MQSNQFVIFELGDELYGAPIGSVKEIQVLTELTPVPNAPEAVAGIMNVRGQIIAVVDLAKRFALKTGKPTPERQYVLITFAGETSYGVMVDQVTEIARIGKNQIKHSPELLAGKIGEEYLLGVAVLGESKVILLLDLTKILSAQELESVRSKQNK